MKIEVGGIMASGGGGREGDSMASVVQPGDDLCFHGFKPRLIPISVQCWFY
jgi:hypothetical protein